ncbi:MAG: flavin reductase family protein [Candidatus Izemoplasmatales bacterium]|nr:flavin reductase family protein [Candidatus Izemoplasmatales bacterium]
MPNIDEKPFSREKIRFGLGKLFLGKPDYDIIKPKERGIMIQEISVFDYAGKVLEQIDKGIFLTTKYQDTVNTMTIGWGGVVVIWGRPLFLVLVRDSRATYELIEKSNEFTVSIPLNNQLARELAICGTKSLREVDKFKACGLTAREGRKIATPIIGEAGLHYECKVIYKLPLDQAVVPLAVKNRYYHHNANHTVYYGEIQDQYIVEGGE